MDFKKSISSLLISLVLSPIIIYIILTAAKLAGSTYEMSNGETWIIWLLMAILINMSINHSPKIYWQSIAIIFLPIDSLASLFLPSYHQNHLMASCFTWTSLPIIVRFYCIFNWPTPIQTIPNCFLINFDLFSLKLPRNIPLLDPR